MNSERRSIFTLPAGRRSKWVVFLIWLAAIFIAAGPANLPGKFSDAEDNESTSFLPGDAESTEVLAKAETLQGGELAPAVIVYRREAGLTDADRQKITEDAGGLTEKRFPAVVADGATAASGGQSGDSARGSSGGSGAPAGNPPTGCAGPTSPVPGQPSEYAPFVGPICSEDGKAAIVTAYLKGDGESESLLDPVQFWRDTVSDPGEGLDVKLTGGAGYAADAIEVFENINGTLLLAAALLVIILLILIYRSPIFFLIPLTAVMFAEILSRSVGYGVSEFGVTINGQSSSIMSVLVLGAGTDYALLIVARYREELHNFEDRHEAMAAAMRSAGPAVLASAATVIAALLCLTIAKVNGTAGLGPIGAIGVACAAISMLTLLPALLTIYGRRAFWPFVPHTQEWAGAREEPSGGLGRRIVEGSHIGALLPAIAACLLFPFFLLGWIVKTLIFLVTFG
ncbi:MAG: MMPL family transporter, partial [Thermoleophilaceae bacterium]|nr:MMPL family transporter [Thermoleophilaceae bacterium]